MKRLIATSLVVSLLFAAVVVYIAFCERRSFPDETGAIVFELGYPNPNPSRYENKLDVDVLRPGNPLLGEQFETLIDPESAFPQRLIDDLDCSPDGRSLMVSSQYLYQFDLQDKALRQITVDPHLVLGLAWSPDGQRIAFSEVNGRERAIFSANADGSKLKALTYNTTFEGSLAWSPDSREIAFNLVLSDGGPEQTGIAIMDAATGMFKVVYKVGANLGQLTWSPDGRRIAFQMRKQGRFDIYTIQPDGSTLTRLTDANQQNATPRWSPDGSLISYSSLDASGHYQLYAMKPDGSDAHLVFAVPPGEDAYNLCWLPAQPQKENS